MLTRREFGAVTLAGLGLRQVLRAADSTIAGVRIGVQTYSFRQLPRPEGGNLIAAVIDAMRQCGLAECELYCPHLEPQFSAGRGASPEAQREARENLRKWRLETPLSSLQAVRRQFEAAGLSVFGFNYTFREDFTDAEIDRGFVIARALGATVITASTTIPVAARVAPFADKHKMMVAMHNHSNVDRPGEFATPESFAAAMKMSRFFRINLDVGHFTAANYDPVAYLREHHADITNIHLKDRKKNQGDNTPWGEGDTPIREVLQLLKAEKWPIRVHIEYEYKGAGTPIEETKKCFEYARRMLA